MHPEDMDKGQILTTLIWWKENLTYTHQVTFYKSTMSVKYGTSSGQRMLDHPKHLRKLDILRVHFCLSDVFWCSSAYIKTVFQPRMSILGRRDISAVLCV
ncbi:hypothetical protein J6590_069687 [Homalodisca vitripennis]|nr:hypothetical protein J6590_069680 [Homalodisca vitripennis]KAG8330168.1 hypothetical protein J6590_069687 [Homalodisca vitripennis]